MTLSALAFRLSLGLVSAGGISSGGYLMYKHTRSPQENRSVSTGEREMFEI